MKRIVLVGKPGSGKTTLINKLKDNGYKTLIADDIVRKLYLKDNAGYKVLSQLNKEFINDNSVDKEKLFKSLKNGSLTIDKLNKLIHPLINEYIKHQDFDYLELPIVGNDFFNFEYNKIIKLDVTDKIAIQRLIKGRNISEDKAKETISLYSDFKNEDITIDSQNIDINNIIKI